MRLVSLTPHHVKSMGWFWKGHSATVVEEKVMILPNIKSISDLTLLLHEGKEPKHILRKVQLISIFSSRRGTPGLERELIQGGNSS
jgi:hypothetical protein